MTLTSKTEQKFTPPIEALVQRGVIDLFKKAGVHVGNTSQYRQSRVEEGIPDLICHASSVHTFFWFETKRYLTVWVGDAGTVRYNPFDRTTWRPKELSPKQVRFRERATACNVKHFWGGHFEAEQVLVELGLGYRTERGIFCLGRPR